MLMKAPDSTKHANAAVYLEYLHPTWSSIPLTLCPVPRDSDRRQEERLKMKERSNESASTG